jgi:hypothetical protein
MTVSGKTAAPIEAPYFLDSDKPPNMGTVTKAQSDRLHALIEAFGLDKVLDGTAASSQILIAQPGDVARFKAMSGDVSINASGVTQIGNNKLATGMYQDASVTSPKAKLTAGIVEASGDLVLTTSYQDVAGTELKITPAVASYLKVTAVFDFRITEGGRALGSMSVDGSTQLHTAHLTTPNSTENSATTTAQVYLLSLTAASHTVMMRAKREGGGTGNCFKANTLFLYELIAS